MSLTLAKRLQRSTTAFGRGPRDKSTTPPWLAAQGPRPHNVAHAIAQLGD